MSDDEVLDELLRDLRTRFGSRVSWAPPRNGAVTIRCGDGDDAFVGVSVVDPERPSFRLSYVRRRSRADVATDVSVDGVLDEGVAWTVGEVLAHGVVRR